MKHNAINLPYDNDALEPVMSQETIDYHFGRHYKAYCENAAKLSAVGQFKDSPIEDIIIHADGALYNNAAQTLNHELFFTQLTPHSSDGPAGVLLDAINLAFESYEQMRKMMIDKATTLFGSGWVWLASDGGHLVIVDGSNAYTPLVENMQPLIAIDIWEHAYYIDYRNKRAEYLERLWTLLDWNVIEDRYVKCVTCRDMDM